MVAYLHQGYDEIKKKQSTSAELEGLALDVAAEIPKMRRLCQDADRNILLCKEHFPLTDKFGYCRHCSLRELCGQSRRAHERTVLRRPAEHQYGGPQVCHLSLRYRAQSQMASSRVSFQRPLSSAPASASSSSPVVIFSMWFWRIHQLGWRCGT